MLVFLSFLMEKEDSEKIEKKKTYLKNMESN
jgi:hypothetical protein